MPWPLVWFSIRRILIGMVCGAGAGVLLVYAGFGGPQGPVEEANGFVRVLAFVTVVAVLGSVAGGALKASGWAILAGGLIGAILAGVADVRATQQVKGVFYSFLGAPVGALVVVLYEVSRELSKPAEKACVPPVSAGVWDKDLDG
jgi:hypothetical protein